jgi:hypothetical protein
MVQERASKEDGKNSRMMSFPICALQHMPYVKIAENVMSRVYKISAKMIKAHKILSRKRSLGRRYPIWE